MLNSIFFAIYLTAVWPVLWILVGQRLAPKSLVWSITITSVSLGGFSLGAIILSKVIPETLRLSLTQTRLYTPQGVIFGAGVSVVPTFFHYLILSIPWFVVVFVILKIAVGFFALRFKTKEFTPSGNKLQRRLNSLSVKLAQKPPDLLIGHSSSKAFSSLSKIFISDDIVSSLDEEKLDAVLAHEVSHVKTKDVIALWLWTITSSLAFVLPRKLAWNTFITELEKKADRNAANIIGSPFPVAEAIVSVARLSLLTQCATNFASGDLEQRIEALVSKEAPPKSKPVAFLVALGLACTLIFTPIIWPNHSSVPIPGISEAQYHNLLEGKAIALVRKTNNPQRPVTVKIMPKEAIKFRSNGTMYLDMSVTFGRM